MLISLLTPRFSLCPYTTLFRSAPLVDFRPFAVLGSVQPRLTLRPGDNSCPLTVARSCLIFLGRLPGSADASLGSFSRSEEHTSELQSLRHLVCRLLLEKKKKNL